MVHVHVKRYKCMIQWTKIIWVNNQRRLINSFSKANKSKNHGRWIGCSFWEVLLRITHNTIHNTYLTLNNIHYALHTTHYIPFGWHDYCQTDERGQRTEERGQRKEDIWQRKEDRGKRIEDGGHRLSKSIFFARLTFLFESFAQTKWAKNQQIFRKITQKR